MLAVRAVLIAGMALLALAVGLAAAPTASAQGASTATTTLRPGLNLAGWTQAEADAAALFEAIPQLDMAYAWDAGTRRFRWAARDGSGDLRTLTPSMGLWLALGGAERFTWKRPMLPPGGVGLVPLREGWNLVTWSGTTSTLVADAFAGLDGRLTEAWGWDARAQRRTTYSPTARANTLRTLSIGRAYWVHVSADAEWWQFPPQVVFLGEFKPARKAELRTLVDDVVSFFIESSRIAVPNLIVWFEDVVEDNCGSYSDTWIRLSCPRALAHEYTHAIQDYLRSYERSGQPRTTAKPEAPIWITEGMANHWSGVYHASTGERPLDTYFSGTIFPEARRASADLQSLEIHEKFHSGDRSAHYSLAYLAIEYLIELTNEEALFTYYRKLFSENNWGNAFQEVFDLDTDRFYSMFEEHRARNFPPHARVSGTVLGPGDEPLEGVRVRGDKEGDDGRTWEAITGPDGAFDYPVERGAYIVSFTDLPPDDCHFGWYDGDSELTSRGGEAVSVTVGDAGVQGIDIRLSATPDDLTSTLCARVEGVVLGPGGEPLPGIDVRLYRRDRLNEGAWTDTEGAFSIVVPDGAYEFSLSDEGCDLGLYDSNGKRWTGVGRPPVITVADAADVTDIVIRLSQPLSELCQR